VSQEKKTESKPESPEKPKTTLTTDSLKEMMQEVTKNQLQPIVEKIATLESSLSKSSKVEDVAQHIKDCPECYSKVWDLFSSAKHECIGCGMPWIQDEATISKDDFSCPGCKSTAYTDKVKK
jgi:rRNA maturation endonuclease Nob1